MLIYETDTVSMRLIKLCDELSHSQNPNHGNMRNLMGTAEIDWRTLLDWILPKAMEERMREIAEDPAQLVVFSQVAAVWTAIPGASALIEQLDGALQAHDTRGDNAHIGEWRTQALRQLQRALQKAANA